MDHQRKAVVLFQLRDAAQTLSGREREAVIALSPPLVVALTGSQPNWGTEQTVVAGVRSLSMVVARCKDFYSDVFLQSSLYKGPIHNCPWSGFGGLSLWHFRLWMLRGWKDCGSGSEWGGLSWMPSFRARLLSGQLHPSFGARFRELRLFRLNIWLLPRWAD